MRDLVAACVQISVTPNDVEANIQRAAAWLETAVRDYGAELVVFPETITTGFVTGLDAHELWDLIDEIPGRTTHTVQEAAWALGTHLAWPTHRRGPERGTVMNSAAFIGRDGEIIGIYDKTRSFPLERAEMGGWITTGTRADVFRTALGNIGIIICFDGDFPELVRLLAVRGAEIIVRPSALLRSFDIWHLTNAARAYNNHVYATATTTRSGRTRAEALLWTQHDCHAYCMAAGPGAWRRGDYCRPADPQLVRYFTTGNKGLQMFDHQQDRNLALYPDILQEAQSPFEVSERLY